MKVLGMSVRIKEPHHQNAPEQHQKDEYCDEDDLHQHVEHYETLILEKNNEIKGLDWPSFSPIISKCYE